MIKKLKRKKIILQMKILKKKKNENNKDKNPEKNQENKKEDNECEQEKKEKKKKNSEQGENIQNENKNLQDKIKEETNEKNIEEEKKNEDEDKNDNKIFQGNYDESKINKMIYADSNIIFLDYNSKYLNLDSTRIFYFVCPDCKSRIPHIEAIQYDMQKNDFIIEYNCQCNFNSKKSDLYFLLNTEQPLNLCINHCNNILDFYCKDCKKSFCELCKEQQIGHVIEDNNNFISQEIADLMFRIIDEKKDEFKGGKILNQIKERYLNDLKRREEEKKRKEIEKLREELEEKEVLEEKMEIQEEEIKEYYCSKILKDEKSNRIFSLIELQSGLLAAGSEDSKISIWLLNEELCVKQIQENGQVFCLLEFEPNKLLSGTNLGYISLRDVDCINDEFIYNFIGHENYVLCLEKCNNNCFASAGNDGTIRIWDYYQKEEIRKIDDGDNCILCLIKLKNGNLCSGGSDFSIKFWDWENEVCLKIIKNAHKGNIKSLCEIKENFLLSGSDDNTIKIWKEYQYFAILEDHKNSVRTLCKINNNYFASGSFDNRIKIWDFKNLKCIQTLEGHYSNVNTVIKLKNNNLASCSMDKTIKIWEQQFNN